MENNIIALESHKGITVEYLINEVTQRTVSPQDKYEIAAILESMGWNDTRVEQRFGVEDIFELSTLIWDQLQEKVKKETLMHKKKIGLVEEAVSIIKSFVRGLVFALPMVISVTSMLTLRLSLWSYEHLSTELATSIAIGTILSFMSVGGFMQVIAVQGFSYLNQGFYNSAKKFTFFILRKGYLLCFIVALIYALFNAFYYNFTGHMVFIIIAYYLCLSSLWFSVTVMYILQRQFTFVFLITAGIGIVYLLFYIIGLNIIISQLIALIIVAVVGLILLIYFFNKEEDKNERNIALRLPKMSILLYRLTPFFAYGFLYFTFLYVDRILAWSTDNFYMPYIIWFRGNYELGLDFALLALIVPLGMSEVIVARFMEMLQTSQKLNTLGDDNAAAEKYLNTYIKSMMVTVIISTLSGIVSYMAVSYINTNPSTIFYNNYLHNAVTYFVFIIALISYSILALALTNAMILLSLSQPKMVTRVMFWSLISNFIFGFILSRWFGYKFAVLGLMIGAITFFIGTTYYIIKVLKDLDYYLYFTL